jgi:hypothetical protein
VATYRESVAQSCPAANLAPARQGAEGTFNRCSFWLIQALTRAGATSPPLSAEARLRFEQMLGYANHLGLYAEQTGPSGEALGNFPPAFTHLALISVAYNLDRALWGRPGLRPDVGAHAANLSLKTWVVTAARLRGSQVHMRGV